MTSIKDNGVVQFEFFRRGVKDVRLIGDFTGWEEHPLAMVPSGNGWWTVSACLESGEYRFRYCAGGETFPDYAAYGIEMTEHGTHSVLVVTAPSPTAQRDATLAA